MEPSWALVFGILKEEYKGRGSVSGDCLENTVPEVQGSTWNKALSGSLPSGYSPLTLHFLTGCTGLIGSPYPQPSWTQIPFGPLDFPPSSGWKDSLIFFLFKDHLFLLLIWNEHVTKSVGFHWFQSVCWRGLDKRGGWGISGTDGFSSWHALLMLHYRIKKRKQKLIKNTRLEHW